MGLLIVSLAAGNENFLLQKDLVGAIDDGETAKQQFLATDETTTETGSESDGLYGFFEGDGPSSTPRNLQDDPPQGARMMRLLRIMPILGLGCCVCAIAGVGAKFFLGAGRTQAAS